MVVGVLPPHLRRIKETNVTVPPVAWCECGFIWG